MDHHGTASTSDRVDLFYDAQGNLVKRKVVTSSAGTLMEFYIRDATGNILAVYEGTGGSPAVASVKERYIYGSDRVARMLGTNPTSTTLPERDYELHDHLGNVRAVLSDYIPAPTLTGTNRPLQTTTLTLHMQAFYNYYAFGSQQHGRSWANSPSKFTFNGKLNMTGTIFPMTGGVDAVSGLQDYGFRWYRSDYGRFLSVDPIAKDFPWNSPYAFAENRVIEGIDLEGLEFASATAEAKYRGTTVEVMDVQRLMIQRTQAQDAAHKRAAQYRPGSFSAWNELHGNGYDSKVEAYRTWQSEPGEHEGESSFDRRMRIIGYGTMEARREFASGGYNMFGGYGRLSRVAAIADELVTSGNTAAEMGFSINANKFNYFFGKVTEGPLHNVQRSAQNLKDLTTMGITSPDQLIGIFKQALNEGRVISTKTNEFGTTVMRSVNVSDKGSIGVGYFYKGGDMTARPSISTIIPKVNN